MKTSKQIYVIKLGGELMSDATILNSLCKEIARLQQANLPVVLIHGGGQQTSEMQIKLGTTPNKINGRRVTDEKTLDIIKMVIAGKINIDIVNALQSNGLSAVGLSGIDGGILKVTRRPPMHIFNIETQQQHIIDYGFVGDIISVNPELILTLLDNHFLPVIAPVAADDQGIIYNINADTVASSIALALHAVQWIILTHIDGVYDHQGKTLAFLSCQKARELIAEGTITNGMIPKMEAILSAIKAGIKSVHMINGFKPERLADLCHEKSLGTLITMEDIY